MWTLTAEAETRLRIFVDLLLRWNPRINLLSRDDLGRLWPRHIEDSLQLLPLLRPLGATHVVDLGSGGGFPGLVLAIASDVLFHLVEADHRKAAFLREAARVSGANVIVHAKRIEHLDIGPVPAITARALAPLPRLLKIAAPLIGPSTNLLLLKGAHAGAELTEAKREWHMTVNAMLSMTHSEGVVLQLSEIVRVADTDRSHNTRQ